MKDARIRKTAKQTDYTDVKTDFDASKESSILRRNIIRKTYTMHWKGDKNTYFIDGETLHGKIS